MLGPLPLCMFALLSVTAIVLHVSTVLMTTCGRIDYLLISHFLLNLQSISAGTSDSLEYSSESSFVRSTQGQVSTIHFVNSIIGNLGAPLRDGPLTEDDDEDGDKIAAESTETPSGLSRDDEELHVGASSPLAPVNIKEEMTVESSKIPK